MTINDAKRSFGFLLYDAARLLRRNFERRAKGSGLTRAQWSVLAHLCHQEGIRQAVLADILDVEPITVCRLIDKLEAAGWVERRHDPADRRVRTLYLTPQAHEVIDEMRAYGAATVDDALAGLPEAARETLIDLLIRVRANLSEREGAG